MCLRAATLTVVWSISNNISTISIFCYVLGIVILNFPHWIHITSQIAKFMGPTRGPPGSCQPQMGPMLAPWTVLSGLFTHIPEGYLNNTVQPRLPNECQKPPSIWVKLSGPYHITTWQCMTRMHIFCNVLHVGISIISLCTETIYGLSFF